MPESYLPTALYFFPSRLSAADGGGETGRGSFSGCVACSCQSCPHRRKVGGGLSHRIVSPVFLLQQATVRSKSQPQFPSFSEKAASSSQVNTINRFKNAVGLTHELSTLPAVRSRHWDVRLFHG